MIKLIAFDLDGTFLDDKKNIPPENLRALEQAAARGALIVPATGRIYTGIPESLRTLPFMRWYITVNGAFIYDAFEDRAAARAEVPLKRAIEFYEYCDRLGLLYDCYQDNWGFMTAEMLETASRVIPDPGIRRLIVTLRTPVPELKAYLREKGADVQKLQLYFTDMDLRARMLRELPERFPDLSVSSSVPFNIEVNAGTATKGQALETLCGLLGIARRRDQRPRHDRKGGRGRRNVERRPRVAGGGGPCHREQQRRGLCSGGGKVCAGVKFCAPLSFFSSCRKERQRRARCKKEKGAEMGGCRKTVL